MLSANQDNETDAFLIAEENGLTYQLEFRTADLLEKGHCLIWDKNLKEPVSEVRVWNRSDVYGPLCGSGGRHFYLNYELLFEVMDWIS
jgi:hypothetical protein